MGRSLSANQFMQVKHKQITLGGQWGECIGTMDREGVVFFWGNSGNGKTTAVMQFCVELCRLGMKGLYFSKEEGTSLSLQNTVRRTGAAEFRRFQFDNGMTFEEMDEKLSKPRSWDFVVIDSFQHTQLNYKRYLEFKSKHPKKLLIFISHCDGKYPAGRSAKSVMYDAGLKIWVEGYKAFSKGRFIGPKGSCTIWEEGAQKYWGG